MSKIDLETKIEGLKKAIAEHKDFAGTYEGQLKYSRELFSLFLIHDKNCPKVF